MGVHCKFAGMRRKVPLKPKHIHGEMLLAFSVVAVLGVPATLAVWRLLSRALQSLKTLPGGYQENDQVISLHGESSLGLSVGDVGVVVGRSKVDPDRRVRCCFMKSSTINIYIEQIAKKGEPLLGPFCAGDIVVSNILEHSVTLGNAMILEHGKFGKVIKVARGFEDRVTCVFQEPKDVLIDVKLSEIKFKQHHMKDAERSMKASVDIRKEQRRMQKVVVQAWQGKEQELIEDNDVAEAFLCTLCEDLLLEPVTLVCGHTMCKCCVEAWKAVCQQPFKSPCCAQVVPYKLAERGNMHRDIEKLYPLQLTRRIAEHFERHSQQPAGEVLKTGNDDASATQMALHGQ